jgi:hypothetical protein
LISWFGKRRIIGLISGTVSGLFLAIWRDASVFDTVAFTVFCAFSGVVLAQKSKDRLVARNIILGALAGSVLYVIINWLMGKYGSTILLRNAMNGALLGAIIGSEPHRATRGAKIGGSIGAVLGLVLSSILVIKGEISVAVMRTGLPPFEVSGHTYVIGYIILVFASIGAMLGAYINAVPQ